MLSKQDIQARLRDGSLSVFPVEERDISSDGIDVRIGTEFIELPRGPLPTLATLDVPPPRPEIHHRALGERMILQPGELLLVTSLEVISLPCDLTGYILPLSSVGRVGLSVNQAVLSPSFAGKATLTLSNLGRIPLALYPGLKIATLSFFAMNLAAPIVPVGTAGQEQITPEQDVKSIRKALTAASESVKSDHVAPKTLAGLLQDARDADKRSKGRKLEQFAAELLRSIQGLKIIRSNAQLRAEEFDILVQNDLAVGFWRLLGSPIVVECKNWNRKVAAADIATLEGKLASLGPDVKTAILVAPNGITGDSNNDAWLKIRELRQRKGILVLVLDSEKLENISSGQHPADVIERAYQSIWLI